MNRVVQTDIVPQPNGSTVQAVRNVRPAKLRPPLTEQEPDTIRICWAWWRINQSEYHAREAGEYFLGDIDA
jgi:hypothetical protein